MDGSDGYAGVKRFLEYSWVVCTTKCHPPKTFISACALSQSLISCTKFVFSVRQGDRQTVSQHHTMLPYFELLAERTLV